MDSKRVKIIVEGNIPYFKGMFDNVADVSYLQPEDITAGSVREADAIVTRTRTRCDAALLHESRCSLIASATIGLDHVDVDWCGKNGIEVKNAPGCNAPAVAQYVFASLIALAGDLKGKTLGVVGVGHVGGIIADWGRQLGMNVLICDPPRADAEGSDGFVTMSQIASESDFITFHTPLVRDGRYPTYHLLDKELVGSFAKSPVVINSARGSVTDTQALLYGLDSGKISEVVIDCWENEPDIDRRLLDLAAIATPHIAGYSRQGKIRASQMAARAVSAHFGLPLDNLVPLKYLPEKVEASDIKKSYNPLIDTEALKAAPETFECLRNNYALREEVLFNEP